MTTAIIPSPEDPKVILSNLRDNLMKVYDSQTMNIAKNVEESQVNDMVVYIVKSLVRVLVPTISSNELSNITKTTHTCATTTLTNSTTYSSSIFPASTQSFLDSAVHFIQNFLDCVDPLDKSKVISSLLSFLFSLFSNHSQDSFEHGKTSSNSLHLDYLFHLFFASTENAKSLVHQTIMSAAVAARDTKTIQEVLVSAFVHSTSQEVDALRSLVVAILPKLDFQSCIDNDYLSFLLDATQANTASNHRSRALITHSQVLEHMTAKTIISCIRYSRCVSSLQRFFADCRDCRSIQEQAIALQHQMLHEVLSLSELELEPFLSNIIDCIQHPPSQMITHITTELNLEFFTRLVTFAPQFVQLMIVSHNYLFVRNLLEKLSLNGGCEVYEFMIIIMCQIFQKCEQPTKHLEHPCVCRLILHVGKYSLMPSGQTSQEAQISNVSSLIDFLTTLEVSGQETDENGEVKSGWPLFHSIIGWSTWETLVPIDVYKLSLLNELSRFSCILLAAINREYQQNPASNAKWEPVLFQWFGSLYEFDLLELWTILLWAMWDQHLDCHEDSDEEKETQTLDKSELLKAIPFRHWLAKSIVFHFPRYMERIGLCNGDRISAEKVMTDLLTFNDCELIFSIFPRSTIWANDYSFLKWMKSIHRCYMNSSNPMEWDYFLTSFIEAMIVQPYQSCNYNAKVQLTTRSIIWLLGVFNRGYDSTHTTITLSMPLQELMELRSLKENPSINLIRYVEHREDTTPEYFGAILFQFLHNASETLMKNVLIKCEEGPSWFVLLLRFIFQQMDNETNLEVKDKMLGLLSISKQLLFHLDHKHAPFWSKMLSKGSSCAVLTIKRAFIHFYLVNNERYTMKDQHSEILEHITGAEKRLSHYLDSDEDGHHWLKLILLVMPSHITDLKVIDNNDVQSVPDDWSEVQKSWQAANTDWITRTPFAKKSYLSALQRAARAGEQYIVKKLLSFVCIEQLHQSWMMNSILQFITIAATDLQEIALVQDDKSAYNDILASKQAIYCRQLRVLSLVLSHSENGDRLVEILQSNNCKLLLALHTKLNISWQRLSNAIGHSRFNHIVIPVFNAIVMHYRQELRKVAMNGEDNNELASISSNKLMESLQALVEMFNDFPKDQELILSHNLVKTVKLFMISGIDKDLKVTNWMVMKLKACNPLALRDRSFLQTLTVLTLNALKPVKVEITIPSYRSIGSSNSLSSLSDMASVTSHESRSSYSLSSGKYSYRSPADKFHDSHVEPDEPEEMNSKSFEVDSFVFVNQDHENLFNLLHRLYRLDCIAYAASQRIPQGDNSFPRPQGGLEEDNVNEQQTKKGILRLWYHYLYSGNYEDCMKLLRLSSTCFLELIKQVAKEQNRSLSSDNDKELSGFGYIMIAFARYAARDDHILLPKDSPVHTSSKAAMIFLVAQVIKAKLHKFQKLRQEKANTEEYLKHEWKSMDLEFAELMLQYSFYYYDNDFYASLVSQRRISRPHFGNVKDNLSEEEQDPSSPELQLFEIWELILSNQQMAQAASTFIEREFSDGSPINTVLALCGKLPCTADMIQRYPNLIKIWSRLLVVADGLFAEVIDIANSETNNNFSVSFIRETALENYRLWQRLGPIPIANHDTIWSMDPMDDLTHKISKQCFKSLIYILKHCGNMNSSSEIQESSETAGSVASLGAEEVSHDGSGETTVDGSEHESQDEGSVTHSLAEFQVNIDAILLLARNHQLFESIASSITAADIEELQRACATVPHPEVRVAIVSICLMVQELERERQARMNQNHEEEVSERALARNSESSMVELTPSETRCIDRLKEHYASKLAALNREMDSLPEGKKQPDKKSPLKTSLIQDLERLYNLKPAEITIAQDSNFANHGPDVTLQLPLHWEEFKALDLTPSVQNRALTAYHQHIVHTAWRFVQMNNPWLSDHAHFVVQDEPKNPNEKGFRRSNFERFQELIDILYLAAADGEALITKEDDEGSTQSPSEDPFGGVEGRVNFFFTALAGINRAHNWDRTRVNDIGKREEYDDLEGDKPSCSGGIRRRLFDALQGHPLMGLLTKDCIRMEMNSFVKQHIDQCIANACKDCCEIQVRAALMEAFEDYLFNFEQDALVKLQIFEFSVEQKISFETMMEAKYQDQYSKDKNLVDFVQKTFFARSFIETFGSLLAITLSAE